MRTLTLFLLMFGNAMAAMSQTINISVDVSQNRKAVSPYIYGINNALSDEPGEPLPDASWQKLKDAGIKLFRDIGGNNATKYNWRLKLSSHPDWYNNVYAHDWDYLAQSLQENIPGARGLFAFQLIGKAAKTTQHNFNDWAYNGSEWTEEAVNNWAGGGGPASVGGNGGDGNPDLYLENWTADSTVGILDKWFGTGKGSLNLNKSAFPYWNMDNEPEIWEGTHDDVMPQQCTAEEFMQKYFAVAMKARAKFPKIKLVGAVPCSEWFWYAWNRKDNSSGLITYKGKDYCWLEYFIKRIGEKQDSTGIRLLDVVDLHTYLSASSEEELMQVHRVFFDQTYDYPHANGVKLLGAGGWDESLTQEYIFRRVQDWLTQYLGADNGVTLGSTESGWNGKYNQMPAALNYASTLGVFANEGVELYTPWYWEPSYWEVVHLFSRYSKQVSVKSTSSDDNNLSAYSTVSNDNDSLTVVLVNRNTAKTNATISLVGFNVTDGLYKVYLLSNLPDDNSTETFVSHTNNALKSSMAVVSGNKFSLTLPAYSISSVILYTGAPVSDYLGVSQNNVDLTSDAAGTDISVYSNVAWTASSNQSWLSVSPSTGTHDGTFTATAAANTSAETRTATITVSGPGVTSQTITVTQKAPKVNATEELIIYNDSHTLIKGTWAKGGTLSEVSSGAYEGNKHMRFTYSFTNWWSGYGLNLTNWAGDGTGYDFTTYESLKFAGKLSGSASVSVILVDANTSTATEALDVTLSGSDYQEITIPLSSFTGMALEDVGEIMINVNGNSASGSGTFYIDDIRLGIKNPGTPVVPEITSVTGNSRCGTGSVSLRATASAGATIMWFSAATGGSSLGTGESFNTPSISSTTTYYAEASLNGATSASRVAVTATINTNCTTGVENNESEHAVRLSPNPTTGQFEISFNSTGEKNRIAVYNSKGSLLLVRFCSPDEKSVQIDLSAYPSGMYVVKLSSDGKRALYKIIKE